MQSTATLGRAAPIQPELTKKKRGRIEGGAISITPISIIIVWAAYRCGHIDWLAVRVWFALWEVKRWHEARVRAGEPYRYDVGEILVALKTKRITKKQVESALATLQTLGIIKFSATTIWFANRIEEVTDEKLSAQAIHMLTVSELTQNHYQKGLSFPRRLLQFIISSKSKNPILVGTALGLTIRCMLVKRYERFKGCCKTSWIADVFGGKKKKISAARSKLNSDGWFLRLPPRHQRVRNIHGDWFALGLEVVVEDEQPQAEPQVALVEAATLQVTEVAALVEPVPEAVVAVGPAPVALVPVENSENPSAEKGGPQDRKSVV